MTRVMVIANNALLADAMERVLAREIDLEVLRLNHHEPGNVCQAIREHRSEVIIIAEGESKYELMTASDLLRNDGRLLVITMSSERHHLYVCESYQMPNPGMAQVVSLVRAFGRT